MNDKQYEMCPICGGVGLVPFPSLYLIMMPCLQCGGTGRVKKGL